MENISNIKINHLEYCILEEDVKLPTNSVRVTIPKLTHDTSSGKMFANTSILINADECKPKSLGSIVLSKGITLKTFSDLQSSKSVVSVVVSKDPLVYNYYLKKGTRMIACFMDNNINDGYLTNFI